MKNLFPLLLVFFLFSHIGSTTGNTLSDDPVTTFDYSGTSLVGGGLSLGYYNYGFSGSRSVSVPPLNAYYEFGFHEFITGGPFAGYGRWDYGYQTSNYTWSFTHLGARGSFHVTRFLNEVFDNDIDEEKIDWYITIMSGIEVRSYNSTVYPDLYDNRMRIFFGPIAGIRYYLGNNFAIYFEGGRGALGALSFGISTRF